MELNNIESLFLDCRGVYLAGGAILSILSEREPNDYDFFFESRDSFNVFLNRIISDGFRIVDSNYWTIIAVSRDGKKYNLIFKDFFTTMEEVVSGFDFKNIMCCASLDRNFVVKTYFDENFKVAMENRVLLINFITKPFESLRRVAKYAYDDYDTLEAFSYIIDLMASRKNDQKVLFSKYY